MNTKITKLLRRGSTLAMAATAFFTTLQPAAAAPNYNIIAKQFSNILINAHYSRVKFDSEIYNQFLDSYLKALDPAHMYFTQEDVDKFKEKYAKTFGDYLLAGDALTLAEDIYSQYTEKALARIDAAIALVKSYKGNMPTFEDDRTMPLSYKNLPWAKDAAALDQVWQNQVDEMVLSEILRRENIIKIAKDRGKEPPKAEELSVDEKIISRLTRIRNKIQEADEQDMMTEMLSSVAHVYDPHSDYMGAREEQRFMDMMRASLVGIGAQLQSDDDGSTTIKGIVKGGPVQKDGQLQLGDHIIAVDQHNDGKWVDILYMSIDKVIDMIRGDKGKTVGLRVLDGDTGVEKIVTIVREEIPIEDSLASAKVFDIQGTDIEGNERNYKLGVITLPSFYIDLEKGDSHCASDIKALIQRMNKEDVEGIILDLRNNGGGSLEEVRKIVGLFTGAGPTVQVRTSRGAVQRLTVSGKAIFSGELVVLTNKLSASASEIFAGAMADYGRAAIVGDTTTFGKGTVQVPRNLGDYLPLFEDKEGSGMIKLTTQKFYRIGGSSTQLKGVQSDIVMPSATAAFEIGESELDNPLPYDEIPKAPGYVKDESLDRIMPTLVERSAERVEKSQDLQYMLERINEVKKRTEDNIESLNKQKRIDESDKRIARKKEIDAECTERYLEVAKQDAATMKIYQLNLEDVDKDTLPIAKSEKDDSFMQREDDPEKELTKSPEAPSNLDAELREALMILRDMVDLH